MNKLDGLEKIDWFSFQNAVKISEAEIQRWIYDCILTVKEMEGNDVETASITSGDTKVEVIYDKRTGRIEIDVMTMRKRGNIYL